MLVSCILIILTIGAITTYLLSSNKIAFTSSFDEIGEKIAENSSTCSYSDYFEIVQAEYMVIPERNLMRQTLIMKNITDGDVTFNYQIYKEQELIDKFVSSIAPALPPNNKPIEILKDKRVVATFGSEFLYPYSTFDEEERKRIEDFSSRIYIEFYKDGKFDYFIVKLKKVKKFTEY